VGKNKPSSSTAKAKPDYIRIEMQSKEGQRKGETERETATW
jgi:hypothetical protein